MDPAFYLDNAATTRILPVVLEETLPLLGEHFGNPSSLHGLGVEARRIVNQAREILARLIGVPPQGVTFTSGGTESNNLALRGVFGAPGRSGDRLLISAIEHPAVRETAQAIEAQGAPVDIIPVTGQGIVDLPRLEQMLGPDVCLVSVMAINNEIGTVQPLRQIGDVVRREAPQAVYHVDAVQAFTKAAIPWREAGIDLISLSGHKVHGPKGVGALVRCGPLALAPLITGGGQEQGLRSGTENPFAVLAFARAAEQVTQTHRAQRNPSRTEPPLEPGTQGASVKQRGTGTAGAQGERDEYHRRWIEFLGRFPQISLFRSEAECPFLVNFRFEGVPGEVTLHHFEAEGLAISTGSACHGSRREPSEVLLAVGLTEAEALSSVRLSFSCENRLADLERVFPAATRALDKLARLT